MTTASVLSAILTPEQDQVLLVKRRDVPVWVLPGGGIDSGESPLKAAQRESYEETGMQIEVVRLAAQYTPLNKLARLTYLYECRPNGGVPSIGAETCAVAFFPINALPHKFFFLHRKWLQELLSNKDHTIQRPIHEVTYLTLLKYFLRHPYETFRFTLSRLGIPING